jgi:hypothetical protein
MFDSHLVRHSSNIVNGATAGRGRDTTRAVAETGVLVRETGGVVPGSGAVVSVTSRRNGETGAPVRGTRSLVWATGRPLPDIGRLVFDTGRLVSETRFPSDLAAAQKSTKSTSARVRFALLSSS